MKRLILLIVALMLITGAWAQSKQEKKLVNWYNKDLAKNKVFGVSTEKAYKELLKGKTSQPVIVAVIDGGTDIKHEDLQGNIWVNEDEIPDNGIDDDKNGYTDDVHGWNFIGNAKGENVRYDTYEVTRLYGQLSEKYRASGDIPKGTDPNYDLYKKVKTVYEKKTAKLDTGEKEEEKVSEIVKADSTLKAYFKKDNYTGKDLKKLKSAPDNVKASADRVGIFVALGMPMSDVIEYVGMGNVDSKYHYNTEFNPRVIVGDDYKDNSKRSYGNNNVIGPDPFHGTFVAGEIGAVRGNKKGADGIASNVKLMIVRVVPDGDERDKDVANGIRYAIENGAKVINMSFGKAFSPQKQFVDEVLPLADKYDVLLVHAAGNDAENNDTVDNYPKVLGPDNKPLTGNWMDIGASGMDKGDNLAARFSNYGPKSVDVFAPGVDLWGLTPNSKYGSASGTSMASPVVAGVAAVIRSYYPELKASEVKDIIMRSSVKVDDEVYLPGGKYGKKISFSQLSVAGGVVNLYNALLLADEIVKGKKTVK